MYKAEEFICVFSVSGPLDGPFIEEGYRPYIITLRPKGPSTNEECYKTGGKLFRYGQYET